MENIDAFTIALTSWLAFLSNAGVEIESFVNPPATEAQISVVEQSIDQDLPEDLKQLYKWANGQADTFDKDDPAPGKYFSPLFGRYHFMSIEDALQDWQTWASLFEHDAADLVEANSDISARRGHAVHGDYTRTSWFPFAADGTGNVWIVDLDPPAGGTFGQVIQAGTDFDERYVIANSLTELFAEASKRVKRKNMHAFGLTLEFEMDWSQKPAPSHARRETRMIQLAISDQMQSLSDWLDERYPDLPWHIRQEVSNIISEILDRDGDYMLCEREHEYKVAFAMDIADRGVSADLSSEEVSYAWQLIHSWAQEAVHLTAARLANVEAIRLNVNNERRDLLAPLDIESFATEGGGSYNVRGSGRQCTPMEILVRSLKYPKKWIKRFLYNRQQSPH